MLVEVVVELVLVDFKMVTVSFKMTVRIVYPTRVLVCVTVTPEVTSDVCVMVLIAGIVLYGVYVLVLVLVGGGATHKQALEISYRSKFEI